MSKERRGIHLIAEMAKVSIGTVDRALHGRGGIKDDTRHRILQIARQIGSNSAGLFKAAGAGAVEEPAFPLLQNSLDLFFKMRADGHMRQSLRYQFLDLGLLATGG